MTGADIAVVEGGGSLAERVAGTLGTLKATEDIAEIGEIRAWAETAEAYGRAIQSREAYQAAAEIKLWAERRAGDIRSKLPRHRGGHLRFDAGEAQRLREQGLSFSQVAQRLGVAKTTLQAAERRGWRPISPPGSLVTFDAQFNLAKGFGGTWEALAAARL